MECVPNVGSESRTDLALTGGDPGGQRRSFWVSFRRNQHPDKPLMADSCSLKLSVLIYGCGTSRVSGNVQIDTIQALTFSLETPAWFFSMQT